MVANIDYLFIVMGFDNDFNLRRLERYIALARQSDVSPVVVLNKSDVATDLNTQRQAVAEVVGDIPVYCVAATTGVGVAALQELLVDGSTSVLLGSSGAGKSTLTNFLLGDKAQPTHTLRESDGRGRHTTTNRQLFVLPSGAHLIDTPGMRELALLDETAADGAFADVAQLAQQCQFSNCDHIKSAGCALQMALDTSELPRDRFEGYLKLQQNTQRVRRVRGR